MADFIKDFFVYSAIFSNLTANSAQTVQIPIQADSDFALQKITHQANGVDAGVQTNGAIPVATDTTVALRNKLYPTCQILITDTGSGRQMMDKAIPLMLIAGTGENPFIMPQPKIFRANTIINVQISNTGTTVYSTLSLAFIGVKLFAV